MPQSGYEIVSEGDDYYARLLRAIRGAKQSIEIMMYIWQDDEIGRLFRKALEKKCRAGVAVTVVADAIGSFDLPSNFFSKLQVCGASVYMHHRWQILRWNWLRYLIRRNHRKLLIVDDKIAVTGGFNIMNECSMHYFGRARWLDLGFITRERECVRQLKRQFLGACRRASHKRWAARLLLRSKNRVILFGEKRAVSYSMSRWLKRRLRKAQEKITIAVPYFIPYGFYWRILVRKLRKGVAVEIILPAKSDVPWVDSLSFYMAKRLLGHGAKIYLYGAELHRFSHAKFFMVDGYSGTGSANYDYRSIVLNLDTLVFTRSVRGDWQKAYDEIRRNSRLASPSDLKTSWLVNLILWLRWLV